MLPRFCFLSLGALLLARPSLAEEPAWKSKSIAQWNVQDAKVLLADSPWVKHVTLQRLRDLSPDERRNGGNMQAGVGNGVGLAGIGMFGARRQAAALTRARAKPAPAAVMVRWESAPVRAAEVKAGVPAPALDDAYYAIVVYGIPLPRRWNLTNELKGVACLRRYHQKDLKPSRVRILREDGDQATVVYLFRRSMEITRRDQYVEFVAQLDRLFLDQLFDIGEMTLLGQIEL
ncbi:MAG: hypothetical protein ABSH50_07430 [Bryobacteraceae bacterium]|jgi:hypothetical protein